MVKNELIKYIQNKLKASKVDRENSNIEENRVYHDAQIDAYENILSANATTSPNKEL